MASAVTALAVLVATLALSHASPVYKRTKGRCYHPIPGTFKLMLGVDITKLDTYTRHGEDGFTKPLFEFSCAETVKLHGKPVQRPFPVRFYGPSDRGSFNTKTNVYATPKDARTAMAAEFGVTGTYGEFGFTDSDHFTQMKESMIRDQMYLSDVSARDFATELKMRDPTHLRMVSSAYKEFKALKGSYEDNKDMYREFVEKYGTHYYSEATLGGLVKTLQKTDAGWVKKNNNVNMKEQSYLMFFEQTHMFKKPDEFKLPGRKDDAFMHATHAELEVFGGDSKILTEDIAHLGTNGALDGWQQSVNDNPYILAGKLVPISQLVRDPQAKDALDDAIRTHILDHYFDNLEWQVDQLMHTNYIKGIEKQDMNELQNIRNGIEEVRHNDPIKEEDLYYANKISTIFENILKKYRGVPTAPKQLDPISGLPVIDPIVGGPVIPDWQKAVDQAVLTQVTKAKLTDTIMKLDDLLKKEYLPRVDEEEKQHIRDLRQHADELRGIKVLHEEHQDQANHITEIMNKISSQHMLVGLEGQEGSWKQHMEDLVHEQINHQSKKFDDQLNEVHHIREEMEHQSNKFHDKLNEVDKVNEMMDHQQKAFDDKMNEMHHIREEFEHRTRDFDHQLNEVHDITKDIDHRTQEFEERLNEVHKANERMDHQEKEFNHQFEEVHKQLEEYEHAAQKFDKQLRSIHDVQNEVQHMSQKFDENMHQVDKVHDVLEHQSKEFDHKMNDMEKMGRHFDDSFKHFDEKLGKVEKMAAEGGAGPKPDPKHYGKWAISAIVDEINRSGRVMFSVILYGTKGWTETLPMAFGERKLKHGSVITDTFETDDIGRPLKMVVFLEGDQGVKLEQFKLSNGDNSYYLNVRRWLAPHTMDDQTRMELEFP